MNHPLSSLTQTHAQTTTKILTNVNSTYTFTINLSKKAKREVYRNHNICTFEILNTEISCTTVNMTKGFSLNNKISECF